MSTEQEREAFEKWATSRGMPTRRRSTIAGDYYQDDETSAAWQAWQARAALAQSELVAESARTANEKLRADQMTKQLDMCNRMKAQAESELATQKQAEVSDSGACEPCPICVEGIAYQRTHMACTHCGEHMGKREADINRASRAVAIQATNAAAPSAPERNPLTDEQIDAIGEAMPGGPTGFLKTWGWRQFTRAIEQAHGIGEA